MVHAELIKAQPGLSFKELRKLERMDAKKAVREKELDLAKQGVSTLGELARTVGTILVGPVGVVGAFLLINYLEKGASFPKSGWKYLVKGRIPPQVIGYRSFVSGERVFNEPIYGPAGPEEVLAGPYDQLDQANLAITGVNPAYGPFIVKYHEYEPALDQQSAIAAKTAVTGAGLGSLIKTIAGGAASLV